MVRSFLVFAITPVSKPLSHDAYVVFLGSRGGLSPKFARSSPSNPKRLFHTSGPAQNSLDDADYLDDSEYLDDVGEPGAHASRRGKFTTDFRLSAGRLDPAVRKRRIAMEQAKIRYMARMSSPPKNVPPKNVHAPSAQPTDSRNATEMEFSEKIKYIESRLLSAHSKSQQLVSNYCDLKYSLCTAETARSDSRIESWKGEYRQIKATVLTRLRYIAVQLNRQIFRDSVDLIELEAKLSQANLTELGRLKEDFFAPELAARCHVDAILGRLNAMHEESDRIASLMTKTNETFRLIRAELNELIEDGVHSPRALSEHRSSFDRSYKNLLKASHLFRTLFHLKRLSVSQIAEAFPFKFFISPMERRIIGYEIVKSLTRRKNRKLPRQLKGLERFYFPPSKSQHTPLLELRRRQLDEMAPFVEHSFGMSVFASEISSASGLLRMGLPQRGLGYVDLHPLAEQLQYSITRQRDHRAMFKADAIKLWVMSWMRVKAEHRLHKLGGLEINQRRGHSSSETLTQNIDRFRQWVARLQAFEDRMIFLQQTSSISKAVHTATTQIVDRQNKIGIAKKVCILRTFCRIERRALRHAEAFGHERAKSMIPTSLRELEEGENDDAEMSESMMHELPDLGSDQGEEEELPARLSPIRSRKNNLQVQHPARIRQSASGDWRVKFSSRLKRTHDVPITHALGGKPRRQRPMLSSRLRSGKPHRKLPPKRHPKPPLEPHHKPDPKNDRPSQSAMSNVLRRIR